MAKALPNAKKRFRDMVKAKTATEREQILEEPSDILEQTRDVGTETSTTFPRPNTTGGVLGALQRYTEARQKKKKERKEQKANGIVRSKNDTIHQHRIQAIAAATPVIQENRQTATVVAFSQTTEQQTFSETNPVTAITRGTTGGGTSKEKSILKRNRPAVPRVTEHKALAASVQKVDRQSVPRVPDERPCLTTGDGPIHKGKTPTVVV